MSSDVFWIDVSGDIEHIKEEAGNVTEIYMDAYRAAGHAVKQATDVKKYLLGKYKSIEENSLRKDNPTFAFLNVKPEMEEKFKPLAVFYNKLQRHAVVLQAMIQDAGDDNKLTELLNRAKRNMVAILGDLEILMVALKIGRMEDVIADVMPNELRKPEAIDLRNVYCIVYYVELLKSLENYLQMDRPPSRSSSRPPPNRASQFFSFGNRCNIFNLALITFLGLTIVYFSYMKKSRPN